MDFKHTLYENIERFGGDKTKITLFGESAGAASTTIQMQNPRLRGVVSRGIAESGSLNGPWAYLNEKAMSRQVKRLAAHLHDQRNDVVCSKHDDKVSLAHCFRSSKPRDLVNAIKFLDIEQILSNTFDLDIPWAPVVDGEILLETGSQEQIDINGWTSFEDMIETFYVWGVFYNCLSKFNEKELMIGHNNHDGYLFTAPALSRFYLDANGSFVIDYDDNLKGQHELLQDFTTKFLTTNDYATDLVVQEATYRMIKKFNYANSTSFYPTNDSHFLFSFPIQRLPTFSIRSSRRR